MTGKLFDRQDFIRHFLTDLIFCSRLFLYSVIVVLKFVLCGSICLDNNNNTSLVSWSHGVHCAMYAHTTYNV